ncbi:PEP-CTERM sorting domain-containing protein [Gemmatimonas groenlandica]|uniref:PEP-CTERM sorting domain-containing protein n=1 Tax=Gemmatimonas groenlandica TaxID=2732249 RepID=A0A6M4ILB0_9BACT|nr:PEP-CTERM sorting domain-containing protein [Gemmatimonas groenlandica]QJR34317.1 PEP-CTERM sorting domain-containing protein [Gemmatimonas groenlandica]
MSAAQTTLFDLQNVCATGLFKTCADGKMLKYTAPNYFSFQVKNEEASQKFTSILMFLDKTANASVYSALPSGWSIDNQPFNGQIWYNGTLCNQGGGLGCPTVYKFDFLNNGQGLAAGASATFNFTLSDNTATPIGFGFHAQSGPNGQSQWIAMGGTGVFNITSVPEPSTYALMASGLLGIFGFARRRRNNA